MTGEYTVRLDHKIHYGIDENGDEYTDITVTHVYSKPASIAPFRQTLRYMKALNLVEILQIAKADEAALKASIDSILGRAASIAPAGRAGFVEIDRPAESSP